MTKDRSEQLRLKEEETQRKQKGIYLTLGFDIIGIYTEEDMYAKLWKEDWVVKCQREDMETVLQIERNKEMLDVSGNCALMATTTTTFISPQLLNTQTAARECEKEDLRILKAREAEILVS